MAERSVDVLLVGGGVASATAAQELRERGFGGSVLLVGRELDPPYERPPLSKSLLVGRSAPEDALLPVPDDVEVLTRTSVMKLDTGERTAALSTKDTVSYEHAILATGANVRRLTLPGAELARIFYLRALRQSEALRSGVEGAERVAIVGGSFIACEVAASLTQMGIGATMLFPEEAPMALQFGAQVGGVVRELLEEHGIEVLAGEQVEAFEAEQESEDVQRVVCASGRSVDCQAVLIGVGAVPDVMLARQSGLELGETGGVACSRELETSAPGVYAAGDSCEYDSVVHGTRVRIEHYEVAAAQGRCAARNVLGAGEAFAEVPYFWSDLADWMTLESVGPAVGGWDEEEVRGSLADRAFSVLYRREDRLVAAVTAGRSEDLDEARAELASRASS
jgi:3-phenylpropionate/trans-cinnamate dioxygenase ferredoxin reductase component